MKIFLGCIAGLLVILGLSWVFAGNDFFLYKFFAPRQAAVQREVFEQTKSFRDGCIQELRNMQFEYIKASKEHKAALASVILRKATEIKEDDLPSDVRAFLNELRNPTTKEIRL